MFIIFYLSVSSRVPPPYISQPRRQDCLPAVLHVRRPAHFSRQLLEWSARAGTLLQLQLVSAVRQQWDQNVQLVPIPWRSAEVKPHGPGRRPGWRSDHSVAVQPLWLLRQQPARGSGASETDLSVRRHRTAPAECEREADDGDGARSTSSRLAHERARHPEGGLAVFGLDVCNRISERRR